MPIKSYIAHRVSGDSQSCVAQMHALPGSTVIAAENRDAWILITDTASNESESAMRKHLEAMDNMTFALVAAFAAEDDLVGIATGEGQ